MRRIEPYEQLTPLEIWHVLAGVVKPVMFPDKTIALVPVTKGGADIPAGLGSQRAISTMTTPAGTTVTASGSVNTKGSWAQLHAGFSIPTDGHLFMAQANTGTTAGQTAYDLGLGAGGAEYVLIADIHHVHASTSANQNEVMAVYHPLGWATSVRLACRSQDTVASAVSRVAVVAFCG